MTDAASRFRFQAEALGIESWEGNRIHCLSLMLFLTRHCFGFGFSEPMDFLN